MATTCDRPLRRCVNLPRRQHLHAKRAFRCSAPAVWNSLPKTVLSGDSVAVFKSMGDSSFPRLSLILLLTNMLPGPSASEVTTSWRNTNLFITGCDWLCQWEMAIFVVFRPPTESTPLDRSPKNLLLLITSATPTAVPNLVQIRPRGASGQMGEI